MKQKIFYAIFAIAVILFFIGLAIGNNQLMLYSKIFPVLSLAALLKPDTIFRRFIIFGFILSAIGDLLLQLPYDLFMYGLIAFLLAHIQYIIAFVSRNKSRNSIALFTIFLLGIIELKILHPHLGSMEIPVAIYMVVILTMLWRAFSQRKADNFAKFAFWGAILFVISDSVIAFDKFYTHFSAARWIIMISYWAAQFMIFYSAYKQKNNTK